MSGIDEGKVMQEEYRAVGCECYNPVRWRMVQSLGGAAVALMDQLGSRLHRRGQHQDENVFKEEQRSSGYFVPNEDWPEEICVRDVSYDEMIEVGLSVSKDEYRATIENLAVPYGE
jgi:hypothetical protein